MLASQHRKLGMPASFAATDWTMVLESAQEETGAKALERLCRTYWRPVFGLMARRGIPPIEAEDLTQEFFAELLEKKWLQEARQERGSFRGFLRIRVHHFLMNDWRHRNAQKRCGLRPDISLEAEKCALELQALSSESDIDQLFDRMWAQQLFDDALSKLENDYAAKGRAELFAALHPLILQPPEPGAYDRFGRQLGLRRNQIAQHVHQMKSRYHAFVRAEIARTLPADGKVDDELRHLAAAFRR